MSGPGPTPAPVRDVPPPAGPPVHRFRREPFRLFFPLGVALGWLGVGHWLLYATGVTTTYSCQAHGLVQVQGFLMAFATGFLLTALPRRTASPPPSAAEVGLAAVALTATSVAAIVERWRIAEAAYGAVFALLLRFALRRFLGRGAGRRPPAAFVLVPLAALAGVAGGALLAGGTLPGVPAGAMTLGRLLVEQGVFLCLAVGVGSLVLPLMAGAPPPADLGSAPGETRRAVGYAAVGAVVLASLALEHAGWGRTAPLVRAAAVAAGLALGGGALGEPRRPGLHRRLARLAAWLMPAGLTVSAAWPDYRVPALHVLFIGGFGLLAFAVATHVSFGHLGLEAVGAGSPTPVIALAAGLGLALAARFVADWSDSYFAHLGWAAACWIGGSAAWLAYFGPRLLRR